MAKTFSLAVYAITIHTYGNKNDRQVLSDFNNGQDFLEYMDTMITSWKQDVARGDQYVPVNTDAEPNAQQGNAYRLSRKPDGTYHLYRRGRYLSGIIESGEYGTQEDGVDISTGELKFQKGAGEALMKPFYFMFYIPENSNVGFLLIEKISNYGIMTVLNNAILKFYQASPSEGLYTLRIAPLSIDALVQRKMQTLRYEAKKIELRKVTKDDLSISRISGNTINNEGISTTITYNIGINQYMRISEFLNWIRNKRNDANTLYVIEEDLSCSDIAITVKIDGQDKVLSLQDFQSLGMSMDISTDVVLGPNRYPTYSFVDGKANELISFIQEQFNVR